VVLTRKVRPKDKRIIAIDTNPVFAAAQRNIQLYLFSFPGTITGLRWNLNFYDTTETQSIVWAIMVVRDGVTPSLVANAGDLATPEQNVLAWGKGTVNNVNDSTASRYVDRGQSKSMRRLMGGDKIIFSASSSNLVGTSGGLKLGGAVQFFILS